MTRDVVSALAMALAGSLSACTISAADVARARNVDALALEDLLARGELPEAPVLVVTNGAASGADDLRAAWDVAAEAPHRFVYHPGEAGDRTVRMAYLPAGGAVAGQAFAAVLGITIERHGGTVEVIGTSRATTDSEARLPVTLSAPGGGKSLTLDVVFEPGFDGSLLLPVSAASALGLARHEIPGEVDVQVALGRPFRGRRTRVEASVPAVGARSLVEVVVPAPRSRP